MDRDPADILDRYIIALLKARNIGNECVFDFNLFHGGFGSLLIKYTGLDWFYYVKEMYTIHNEIWQLESLVRQGKLDNNIMEVGRRAIEIRDWNKKRVDLKNQINELCEINIQDIKKDHISE